MSAPHRLRIAEQQLILQRARRQQNIILLTMMAVEDEERRNDRRQRRWWVKPWLQRRPIYGEYDSLMKELENSREFNGDFRAYLRIEPEMFRELLFLVTPKIKKCNERRPPLSAGLKLAITLRFLATGNSYRSLSFNFRVAPNTISLFVPQVCQAICDVLQEEVFKTPATSDEWRIIADGFSDKWNFYHTCGAIDGKHVAIKKPKKSGTLYYNYKGFYSIVLLGIVDSEYKFIWANVGANGSASDCGVFNNTGFINAISDGSLDLPAPESLPGDTYAVPYFFIGDDAFPLRQWMMKPFSNRYLSYEERIFNYRCSRARRCVENAFGILSNRFRCLLTTLATRPKTTTTIVKACLVLHNKMRIAYPTLQNYDLDKEDEDGRHIPGLWRDETVMKEVEAAGRTPGETKLGKQQRTYLKCYYNSIVGRVSWQDRALTS